MQDFTGNWAYIAEFVQNWGYLAVFLGSMIEGESVIFIAGFFAHEGYLSLPKIILVSFVGTLFADQALYFVGRHYGNPFINRFPSFRPRADKAFNLLRRYDNIFILSFRFIYGIRIISPVVIGASGVGVKRFILLNLIAALIWSVGSCVAAYFFAHLILEYLHLMPKIILGLVLLGGGMWYGIHKWRNRKKS
ncbi:MAG: DedA family protein [Alphaproteobacteria bacterium]|nr:DedA family protein [Alphaproteobacteria bacterium]